MEPTPPITASPATPTNRGTKLRTWLKVLGIFLLAMLLLSVLLTFSKQDVLWLKPGEPIAASRSGPLFKIKDKIKGWTLPVWQRIFPRQGFLIIESDVLTVTASDADQLGLGPTTSSNSNGMRAWVLSSERLKEFQQKLKNSSGVTSMSAPRVGMLGGMQSELRTGDNIIGRVSTNQTSLTTPVGIVVEMLPKIVSGSIRLRMIASDTTFVGWSPEQLLLLHTNFAVACQVLIPDAGALVVDTGKAKESGGTNYWLVISPTLMNPDGTPLNPR